MSVSPQYRGSTGTSGRRIWVGIVAVVGLVAIGVLKPWGGTEVPVDAMPSALAARAATRAEPPVQAPPAKSAAELARSSCPGTLLWMVHSIQRRGDDLYNVWTVTEPIAAASADPAMIAYTPIYASHLFGFGYCAPDEDDLRPSPADTVTVWRVDPGGGPLMVAAARSIERDLRPDFGALMGPSASSVASGSPGWPAGRYIVRAGGAVLGVEVVLS